MVHSRYPLTAQYQQQRRVIRSKNTTRTAILGDEIQNIYSDRLGYYFARQVMSADVNGNALLGPTFYLRANPAAGILPQAGRKVLYKKSDRGVWTITGADLDDLEQIGINAVQIEPNDPARGFHYLFQIVNLNSYTVSGLLVNVHPWQYHTSDNVVHFFPGTTAATQVDLTSHAPGTLDTHRYALLVFNITEHLLGNPPLQVYAGTAVSIFPPTKDLTINTDLQTCYDLLPVDELIVPIKAYYLQYGQTTDAGISKNVDVRQFINVPSLNSGAPADATYILQVADGDLPNAQDLGSLSGGILKSAATTGVVSIAAAGTDYTTPTGVENLSGKTITGSTIDSTPIGTTTPDAGRFSSLRVYIGGVYAAFLHNFTTSHTVTIPGDADVTLVGVDTVQTLTGKVIDGDNNTLQDIALSAIKTVGANVKRFITRDASGVISDTTNPPLDNLQHTHQDAAGGGTLTGAALGTQTANTLLAGPTTGSAANPTFRAMVLADIPNTLITLAKMAAGTPGKIMGYLSSGDAAEVDRAVDDIWATWGEGVSLNDFMIRRNSDDKWYKADADDVTRMSDERGVVCDIGTGSGAVNTTGFVRRLGPLGGFSSLTPGERMFLSTTAGGYTQTEPTPTIDGATVMIANYGYAASSGIMFVDTAQPVIYRTYATVAVDAIKTVTHHANIPSQSRLVQARAVVYSEASGASNNVTIDSQPFLAGPSGTTVVISAAGASSSWIGNNAGTHRRIAQSFLMPASTVLSTFTVRFGANVGTPTGAVLWQLIINSGTIPTGAIVASGTFTPTASGDNVIPVNVWLPTGTIYWFEMESVNTQSSGNYWQVTINAAGAYANGNAKLDTGTGSPGYLNTWVLAGGTNDLWASFTTDAADGLATGFQLSSIGVPLRVTLKLKKVGSPTGTLSVLLTNSAMSTVLAASTTYPAASLTTSFTDISFLFYAPSVSLAASTQYFISLGTTDTASATNYVVWGANTASAASAKRMRVITATAGGWATLAPTTNAEFELLVRSTSSQEDMTITQWSGAGNGIGVRRADSSDANADTITRFVNKTLTPTETVYDVSVP